MVNKNHDVNSQRYIINTGHYHHRHYKIIDIIRTVNTSINTIIITINIIIWTKLLKARLTLILNYCKQSI